jgi:nitrite reductase/ring-hydroxylating ferredoxin subunit
MKFIKVAKVSEISAGTMKHIEADGKEICIANVSGKFYAMGDRCGHENARLSLGPLQGTVVTCPMHYSTFDVTTGKLLSGPKLETGGVAKMFEGCPDHVRNEMTTMFQRLAENQSTIKTYDQPVYKIKVEGNDVLVQL